ncbi:MAG: hypothetical protein IPI10_13315 [Bacteroidetes bacterium]|nr:hypothetical protein [Bacteroidota bacterium]
MENNQSLKIYVQPDHLYLYDYPGFTTIFLHHQQENNSYVMRTKHGLNPKGSLLTQGKRYIYLLEADGNHVAELFKLGCKIKKELQ